MANLSGNFKQASASGNIIAYPVSLIGIFVSSATGGNLTVYDDASTGTANKIVDQFTVAGATYYALPFNAAKGLNVVVGGTVSFTVAYN
jgi:hypothetical protein